MIATSLFGSKIRIDPKKVLKQTKTIKENNSYSFNLHLIDGQVLAIKEPLASIPLMVLDQSNQPKTKESSTSSFYCDRILPKAPPTSNSTQFVCSSGKKTLSEGTYRGEMVWTHKTAPEIRISKSNGQIVKDVDVASMYKRR